MAKHVQRAQYGPNAQPVQPVSQAEQDTVAPTHPSSRSIARSAALVISLLALAKLVSLVEKKVALDRFGITLAWDTFTVANQIPEQLFNLLAGGALAYAFIPIFGELLAHDNRDGAWKLASNTLNSIFLAVLAISIVVFFAAPWLVANLVAPGFVNLYADLTHPFGLRFIQTVFHPDLVMQTANLMRILLLSLLLFSISGLSMGILQTHQRFLLPTLAPIMYDVGNLIGSLFLARFFGIYGIAIGAVIGAGLHLGIQIPGLLRIHARWRPTLNWRDPELREVIVLMIPRAIALFLVNANVLLAIRLASEIGEGSVSAYNRGWTLMQLPETLIGTAMGIVIFPTLAMLSATGDLSGKRSAMSGALRFILVASIPSAIAMVLAGRPLVSVLEGGAFDAESADRVFRVVQFFALGIVTQSCVEIVARSFYADKDTITPLWISLITAGVNFGLALLLIGRFNVAGLALANSLAVGVELLLLIVVLQRRWHGIEGRALLTTTIKALAASVVMGAVIVLSGLALKGLPFGSGRIGGLIVVGIQLALGTVAYLGTAILLRMQEMRELPQLLFRRRTPVPIEVPGD
ncbi:MAG: murein biosynthesis integral membrane protein MurJ [Chloroflexota bacterium]